MSILVGINTTNFLFIKATRARDREEGQHICRLSAITTVKRMRTIFKGHYIVLLYQGTKRYTHFTHNKMQTN